MLATDEDLRTLHDGVVDLVTKPSLGKDLRKRFAPIAESYPEAAEALNALLCEPALEKVTKYRSKPSILGYASRCVCHTRRSGCERACRSRFYITHVAFALSLWAALWIS